MTESRKTVSIIVESSATELSSSRTNVLDTLVSLHRQEYPLEKVEIIVCQHGWGEEKREAVSREFSSVTILDGEDADYYYLKELGVRHAQGEVIAFADSDCVYSADWLSTIMDSIEHDADTAIGITHYPGDTLIERLCAFHNFHCILPRSGNRIQRFCSNNVAFKAEVIKSTGYDPRFVRSGGCTQLAERLYRNGKKMTFNPAQVARHNYYDLRTHVWERSLRNGFDMLYTRELDPAMPLADFTKLGVLAPPLFWVVFFLSDAYNLIQNRRHIQCGWYEMPVFLGFSLLMRSLEVVGMYWKLFSHRGIETYLNKAR